MEFYFQYPRLLVLIVLVVPVLYFIHAGYSVREKSLARFSARRTSLNLRSRLVSLLSFTALASLLIIAAGPGKALISGDQPDTGNFVFLIDVSRSMAARYTCNESTRLDRVKPIMSRIVYEIPEAKFGFMGLAGLSFVLSEMSYDRQYLTEVIHKGIFVEVIPMPGSDLANAFHVLLEKKTGQPPVFDSVSHVILFSDGDTTDEEIAALNAVIPSIVQSGLEVISVGVGSEEGVPIPTLDANRQCITGQYERAAGKEFYTHLLDTPLRTVAENTGGKYFHESEVEDIVAYLRTRLAGIPGIVPPQQTEDISFPFIVLLCLSLLGLFLVRRI